MLNQVSDRSGKKNLSTASRRRLNCSPSGRRGWLWLKVEVVSIQKVVRFFCAFFCFRQRWFVHEPVDRANTHRVGMLLPGRVGEHFEHDLTQRLVISPANVIEQTDETNAVRR